MKKSVRHMFFLAIRPHAQCSSVRELCNEKSNASTAAPGTPGFTRRCSLKVYLLIRRLKMISITFQFYLQLLMHW
jgi:hypothetical protein